MEFLNPILSYQIGGQSVRDLMTLDVIFGLTSNLVLALLILFVGFFVAGWVRRRIISVSKTSERFDITIGSFLGNIARYAVLTLTVIFILQNFGVQTTSLVALVGAAGLAIGLALQGVLSGIAAGVMLVIFRPLKVGDFVDVGGVMGTVKDISIFNTELATVDNVQVILPNTEIWGNTITNYSSYNTRRAEWTFGVSYGANLADAERIIRETIMADPRSMTDPEPFVQVNNLGDFSVDFLVRVWVPSADYFGYQADMKRRVKEALDTGGIDIPFPTQTVLRSGD